ncbi:MAG TPA: tetratricopeptide repeat protein [Thermoanaerobaculia bacterium]|nr:tetratricopeptide repeat protein [Thermoanaerobaculia bacterium]
MTQHLTRKEMKRDDFATAVGRGMEYAESHVRTLLLGLGVVALLAVLFVVGRIFLGNRGEQANEELARAMKVYQAPVDATSPKPDDPKSPSFPDATARRNRAKQLFETVQSDYGRTDAADMAGLYLAQIAAEEGQLDKARELWTRFVDDNPKNILAGEARVNLMHLDRQQGKSEDLAQRLKAMMEQDEPGLPKDVVLYELATTQEQLGRKQDALQSWRKLTEEYPESAYRTEAQRKVDALDPSRAAGALGGGIPGLGGGFPR